MVLYSCKKTEVFLGPNLYFENPQPINDSELSKFPNKFKGLYIDEDSLFLKIQENVIFTERYFKFKIHKNELDSLKNEFIFSKGKLINKKRNETYEVAIKEDSIELTNKTIDTIFIFSNTQKAKRINGSLVLNTKDSVFWTIKTISLEKNILKLKYIYSEEDLKKLDSILKEKPKMIDSSSFIIRPTRNEFKKILNLKNFGDDHEFKKVLK